MEDLNLLSENIINQILSKITQINWNEDQVDTILNQISQVEKELNLDHDLILLPNFPYIKGYLDDYKFLIILENKRYILLQDIPNQLYDYLEQIELIPIQGYKTTYQDLEYKYKYHIKFRTQINQIKNQVSDKTESLIKNLIISNNLENISIDLVIKSDKESNHIPEQKPTKEQKVPQENQVGLNTIRYPKQKRTKS